MKNEYIDTLNATLGELDCDILVSFSTLSDPRIDSALGLLTQDDPTKLYWMAKRAAKGLQALVATFPDHKTPIERSTLVSLERITDVATNTKDWVSVLWEEGKRQELGNLTLAMLMAIKHFNAGHLA